MNIEDIKTVDVKDKVVVLTMKDYDFSRRDFDELRKQMWDMGAIGLVALPPETELEALGVNQLEQLVENLKARTSAQDASELSGDNKCQNQQVKSKKK